MVKSHPIKVLVPNTKSGMTNVDKLFDIDCHTTLHESASGNSFIGLENDPHRTMDTLAPNRMPNPSEDTLDSIRPVNPHTHRTRNNFRVLKLSHNSPIRRAERPTAMK